MSWATSEDNRDGPLIEFASVVDGLRCATEWQQGMAERNVDVPLTRHIGIPHRSSPGRYRRVESLEEIQPYHRLATRSHGTPRSTLLC